MILAIDSVNPYHTKRRAWRFLPGQHRVRKAPTLYYDTPSTGIYQFSDSTIAFTDDLYMYNGDLAR